VLDQDRWRVFAIGRVGFAHNGIEAIQEIVTDSGEDFIHGAWHEVRSV
jgi:hypothetical protein